MQPLRPLARALRSAATQGQSQAHRQLCCRRSLSTTTTTPQSSSLLANGQSRSFASFSSLSFASSSALFAASPRAVCSKNSNISGRRHISDNVRSAIDKAVASAPVVLFMKGTPETPQCGFSRASIQILGLQGVDPAKFAAYNVLEDESLRQGTFFRFFVSAGLMHECST